jgi:hypothetical protein
MAEAKHIINILTFSHPEKEIEFGFKLDKEDGHSPLRRGEFPKELWASHQVKTKYPEMVAERFPHFEGGKLYDFGKKNLWFL